MKKTGFTGLALVLASLLLLGCLQNGGNYGYGATPTPQSTQIAIQVTSTPSSTPEASATATPSVSASASSAPMAVSFTVTAKEFSFNPSQLSVSPGQEVTVVFKNAGTYSHTFTIPDLNVNTGPVTPGSQKTVSFTAPMQTGSHEFLCTIPGHADAGMKGTITIG